MNFTLANALSYKNIPISDTSMRCAFIQRLSSLSSTAIALPISSGCLTRPNAVCAVMAFATCSLSRTTPPLKSVGNKRRDNVHRDPTRTQLFGLVLRQHFHRTFYCGISSFPWQRKTRQASRDIQDTPNLVF